MKKILQPLWNVIMMITSWLFTQLENIDWDQMMEWMVAANVEKHRCIYENDDIIVEHQIISYGSSDREALMLVHKLKDGLMWRTESGATPLPTKG